MSNLADFRSACEEVKRRVQAFDMYDAIDDAFEGRVFDEEFVRKAEELGLGNLPLEAPWNCETSSFAVASRQCARFPLWFAAWAMAAADWIKAAPPFDGALCRSRSTTTKFGCISLTCRR